MTHSMLDLETFGKRAGCAIRSIGAVTFKPSGGKPLSEFYVNVNRDSCLEAGLHIDQSTLDWWSKQEKDAQEFLTKDQVPLKEALQSFTRWFKEAGAVRVWAHGAPFDPPILEAAYVAVGMEPPWKFWNVRDTRTLHDMAQFDPKSEKFFGVKHFGLDDARNQAYHVQLCAAKLFADPSVEEALKIVHAAGYKTKGGHDKDWNPKDIGL